MSAIGQAARALVLGNELAVSRAGLRQLIGWLRQIAEDFSAHGGDVADLHRTIRRFERELRRRSGGSHRPR